MFVLLLSLFLNQNQTSSTCTAPITVNLSVQENLLSANWPEIIGASNYDIRIRNKEAENWEVGRKIGNGFTYLALMSCNVYEFQIKSNCTDGSQSEWSEVFEATTSGCVSCEDGIQNGTETGIDCGGENCPPCSDEPCVPPVEVNISSTESSIYINWETPASAINFDLRARRTGNLNWIYGSNLDNDATLNGLISCSNYEFQVKSNCFSTSSTWSSLLIGSTTGCAPCELPESYAVATDSTSVFVSWESVDTAQTFNIRFRELNTNTWSYGYQYISGFEVSELKSCTTYEFQVQTNCPTVENLWSSSNEFTTENCITCEIPSIEWEISNQIISINTEVAVSGDSLEVEVYQDDLLVLTFIESLGFFNYSLDLLDSCSSYGIRYRRRCSNGLSLWHSLEDFVISQCNTATATENKFAEPIKVYPNPFRQSFSVENFDSRFKRYNIYAPTGALLQTGLLNAGIHHFDLGAVNHQLILLQLSSENEIATVKLLKMQ